jgi:proteasome accessory factor B
MSTLTSIDERPGRGDPDRQGRSAGLSLPLLRLLQLVMILQGGRFPNAQHLAEACAVSRRTIYRDLAILEAAGIPVVYRADRQGYQLAGAGFLRPAPLDDREALALLLLSRLCPADQAFGLLRPLRSGVEKILQSLPATVRGRVGLVSEVLAGDRSAPELPADRRPIYEAIWRALGERRQMRLWSRAEPGNPPLTTKLSLYRLARVDGCWCLVGRSTLHREVRLFRIPGIERIEVTEETYTIPPRFRLDRWLSRPARPEHRDAPPQVHLRFSARGAARVREAHGPVDLRFSPLAGGELDVFLPAATPEVLVGWILGFGDQVEVLQPQGLRRAVRERAERIARLHADRTG